MNVPDDLIAIINTGDDENFYGLHVSPDIDTVTYVLSGQDNEQTGWGVKDETYNALGMLKKLGDPSWFSLGDKDLGTHLYRTKRMLQGASLTEITAEITRALDIPVRLLPMTDSKVRTMIEIYDSRIDDYYEPHSEAKGTSTISFQEYFVKLHHEPPVKNVSYQGANEATVIIDIIDSLEKAERILIAPSNPILSIGPILALEPIRSILEERRQQVVAVSPLIAGKALKGPLAEMMRSLYGDSSVVTLAKIYKDVVGTLIIDPLDGDCQSEIEGLGMACEVRNILMSDRQSERKLGEESLAVNFG